MNTSVHRLLTPEVRRPNSVEIKQVLTRIKYLLKLVSIVWDSRMGQQRARVSSLAALSRCCVQLSAAQRRSENASVLPNLARGTNLILVAFTAASVISVLSVPAKPSKPVDYDTNT